MKEVAYIFDHDSRGGTCVGHVNSRLLVGIVKGLCGHGDSSGKVLNRPTHESPTQLLLLVVIRDGWTGCSV